MSWLDIVCSLLDERAIIETCAVAVGSSFSALFYFFFRRTESRANKVRDAVPLKIDEKLLRLIRETPNSKMPYAFVCGFVQPVSNSIQCTADSSIKGVIWRKKTTEHKDVYQRYMQTWHNTTHEISSVFDSVPFKLEGQNGCSSVNLIDPLQSAWIEDSIEIVHQRFMPTPSNVMDNIVGYMSGDKLKGYTETESNVTSWNKTLCNWRDSF